MNTTMRLLGLATAATLIGCTTTAATTTPDPEPYDPEMAFAHHGNVYVWELTTLDAKLADPESLPPEEVVRMASTCARILAANPDHADAPAVAAHLERLRAILDANPPWNAELATNAEGTSIQRVDLNALRRDVQYANNNDYYATLSSVRTWLEHNPHHAVAPELREMESTLLLVPVNAAIQTASYYTGANADKAARRATAFALRTQPAALVELAFAEHYAPRDSEHPPTATLRPRGRTPLATKGPGRPIALTSVTSYMCSRLHHALPDLENDWGDACYRDASAAWVASLVDMPLYTQSGKLDPKAIDATLTAITLATDATAAGLPARDVYALYRPTVAAHLRMWKNIQRVGERQMMRGWRDAKGRADSTGDSMFYTFYSNRSGFPGVFEGFGPNDWHAPKIFGFWLRRIADGTAPVLIDHARKITKAYDPELHDEIF